MDRGPINFFIPFSKETEESSGLLVQFLCYKRIFDYVAKLIYGLMERTVAAVFQVLCRRHHFVFASDCPSKTWAICNIFCHHIIQIFMLQVNTDVNTHYPFWQFPLQSQTNMGFDRTAELFGTNFLDKQWVRWLDPYVLLSPALSTAKHIILDLRKSNRALWHQQATRLKAAFPECTAPVSEDLGYSWPYPWAWCEVLNNLTTSSSPKSLPC